MLFSPPRIKDTWEEYAGKRKGEEGREKEIPAGQEKIRKESITRGVEQRERYCITFWYIFFFFFPPPLLSKKENPGEEEERELRII